MPRRRSSLIRIFWGIFWGIFWRIFLRRGGALEPRRARSDDIAAVGKEDEALEPRRARSDDIAAVGKEDEARVRRQRAAAAARVRRLLDQSLRTPATDDGRLTCQVWEWAGYCQAVLAHRARRRLFVFFLIFF